jgi:glycosyltransferase involved in cell wall biosynthesis
VRVLTINFSGSQGGAAIAALRLHRALLKVGVDGVFWSARHNSAEAGCRCIKSPLFQRLDGVKCRLAAMLTRRKAPGQERSYNIFPSLLLRQINQSDADVVHLHWLHAEMISIRQLSQITKPVIWTLHDMWAICGAAHYVSGDLYQACLTRASEPESKAAIRQRLAVAGMDCVDRWLYLHKCACWQGWSPHIVTPSHWLAELVRQGRTLQGCAVQTIANGLDLQVFAPQDRQACRGRWGIPPDKKVILFGACDPRDPRKGGDLLREALARLGHMKDVHLVVFGSDRPLDDVGLPCHAVGQVKSEADLASLYGVADVLAVPSRLDNLPNTAAEGLACGVPVVGFRVGGLPDLVEHQVTGYLADPYAVDDFSKGLLACLESPMVAAMREKARALAVERLDDRKAAAAYLAVYRGVLKDAVSAAA